MRVLLTNLQLVGRSGTELYVFELAVELVKAGHLPVVYSPRLGPLADQLRDRSIPVVDDLDRIGADPDVIHGNHNLQALSAICHFPDTPAILTCHDCSAWHDFPIVHPRIRKHLAVDNACRERLLQMEGIDAGSIEVAFNGIDLTKFATREPLPERPMKALLFSNYSEDRAFRTIRSACAEHQITLKAAGRRLGGVVDRPEELLRQYDIVFAKGRAAWEALAVGTAVVVCDGERLGGLVTSNNVAQMRAWNFGRRLLQRPLTVASLSEELGHYSGTDAHRVCSEIRGSAGLASTVSNLVDIYQAVISDYHRRPVDAAAESRAVSTFLHWLSQHQRDLAQELIQRRTISNTLRRWASSAKRRWAVRGSKAA